MTEHSEDCPGRPGYKGICSPPCPAFLDEIAERSKNDRAFIAGSEVRQLVQAVRHANKTLAEVVRTAPDEGASNRSAYVEHGMLCASRATGTERGAPCDCGMTEWLAALARARD